MKSFNVQVKVDSKSRENILVVSGDVVGRDSERFCTKLDELITEPARNLVLDLRKVDFMDSAGLGSLVYKHLFLTDRKKKLTVLLKVDSQLSELFSKPKRDSALNIRAD